MTVLPSMSSVNGVRAGVMHQVKKLCEHDVIDLSSKKTDNASASVPASSAMATLSTDDE